MAALTGRTDNRMLGSDNQWEPVYSSKRATLADLIVDGAPLDEMELYYRGRYRKSNLIEGAFETEDFFPTLGEVGKWLHITASPIRSDDSQVIGAIETLQDVTEEKRLQENMRYYVQLITRAQEEERRRLARELHDDLSASLLLLIQRLDSSIPAGRAKHALVLKENLGSLRDEAVEALERVRRYVQDLRPRILDDLGLTASLEWMADDMQKNHGVKTAVKVSGSERVLASDVQLLLFRIAQEALTNVRRHSGASSATVELELGAKAIAMTVSDNGHGFSVPAQIEDLASAGHLGIMGMAERAKLLNGELEIVSTPGEGTRVTTRLPV
jgi:signal transduction histidine kinase